MKTRCCWPPESAPIWTGAKRRMRTSASAASASSRSRCRDGEEPAGAQRATHERHIEDADRESPVDVGTLRHVGDAGTWAVHGLAVEEDLAMRRRQDAGQASQQCALAGAIWTDERGRLTRMEIQGDVLDRGTILEVNAQVRRLHARHA